LLDKKITRRQDSPKVFDMTTVAYIVNTDFIKIFNGIFDGKVRSVCIPTERAIDIDTVLDFRIAEFLLLDRDT
jgi:CMP-N-acetylneuraminic acid synthetase